MPEPAGTLRIAAPGEIETIDPLFAEGPAERLAARQVHEPLASQQTGPFGQTRLKPGLVRSFESSVEDTIWTARLRRGVRFANGTPFDADAVIANVERWRGTESGRELLAGLSVAFSPQPGTVTFQLAAPDPRFPRALASSRLGIVDPDALADLGAEPLPISATLTGTGPFEIREHEAGRTLLARNPDWWGAPLGLGPGVDQIELLTGGDGADQLLAGSAEVAVDLSRSAVRSVAADPLLTVVRKGGALGMERSVRGIESGEVDQPLADAWLSDLR